MSQLMLTVVAVSNMPRSVRVQSLSSANVTGAVARPSSTVVWREMRASSSGGSMTWSQTVRSVNDVSVRQQCSTAHPRTASSNALKGRSTAPATSWVARRYRARVEVSRFPPPGSIGLIRSVPPRSLMTVSPRSAAPAVYSPFGSMTAR